MFIGRGGEGHRLILLGPVLVLSCGFRAIVHIVSGMCFISFAGAPRARYNND